MNFTPQNFQTFGYAVIIFLVLIVALGAIMPWLAGKKGLIMDSEFVTSRKEFVEMVGENREGVKKALLVDTFAFVPVYFLLFMLMTWFLYRQESAWAKYLAMAALVLAVATIFFDLSENFKLLGALKENASETLDAAGSATGKWVCFFVTALILSAAFWKPHLLTVIISAFLILGSIIGMIALFSGRHGLIQPSVLLSLSGLTVCGIYFIFFSGNAVKIFNSK
jgi:TRAP-type uncharacterized transport system fused permease subunit